MCENDEHQDLATLIEQRKVKEAIHLIEHHLLEIEARLHLHEQDKKVNLAEALSGY